METVASLEMMPKRCPIAPESVLLGRELRCLVYRKHYRILYAIEETVVRIYHIRHTSQALMSPEDFLT